MKKAFLALLLFSTMAFAPLINNDKVGTTVMPILKIGFGPRAAAMGEAYVGLSDDIAGLFFNPAGLAQLQRGDALLAHHQWFQSIYDEYAGVVYPLSLKGTAGISAIFSITDEIEHWDDVNLPVPGDPVFSTQAGVFILSYAQSFASRLSLGVNFKGIYDNLKNSEGLGAGIDLGIHYRISDRIGYGLSLSNGGIVRYEGESYRLPLALQTGIAVSPFQNFLFLTDVALPSDRMASLHLGAEYEFSRVLSLRTGYRTGPVDIKKLGPMSGLTAGLGIKLEDFRIDYAFSPYDLLGLTHRLALGYTFGQRPLPGALTAEVIDSETGEPLSANLSISGLKKEELIASHYEAYGLKRGMVSIRAEKGDYYSAEGSAEILPPDTAKLVIALSKIPPGKIEGLVYDVKTKLPLQATLLYEGRTSGERTTDESGNYLTEEIPRGEYKLSAKPDDPRYFPQDAVVMVKPGETTEKDFALLREKEVIIMKDVNFETGKAELLPESYATLDYAGEILISNPSIMVELAGHTDPRMIQSPEFPSNLELSQARAEAVKQYLIQKFAIGKERLIARGYGATQPIVSNATEEGMAINRRTEFKVLSGIEYYQEMKREPGKGVPR